MQEDILSRIIILITLSLSSVPFSWAKILFTVTPTTISATDQTCVYERCRQAVERLKEDDFSPTYVQITSKDYLWHLQKDIQASNEPVMLYSRGFRGKQAVIGTFFFDYLAHGEAFLTMYKYIQAGCIQTATIGFDYLDTLNNFDHGCTIRANKLRSMLNQVQQESKKIILFGDSIGAKTILYLATQDPLEHVSAIVLESPLFDMENMVINEAQHDFWWLPKKAHGTLYDALCVILPKYKYEEDITHEKLKKIPKDIPIFFAHLHNDHLIDNQTALNIVQTLRNSGHIVYFVVIDNPKAKHSRIATTRPFITAVNAFYKAHDLPHDTDLAGQGQEILEHALCNACENNIQHIESA